MSLKKFFTSHEAAEWLGRESDESMQADDIHRLVRQGGLPVYVSYRGHVAAFPIDQDPFAEYPARAINVLCFYFSGYLRIRQHAAHDVPIGANSKKIDVLLIARADVAAPDSPYVDIELPSNTALWPTNDDGDLVHQVLRSDCWLFDVEDLRRLLAAGASGTATQHAEASGKVDDNRGGGWKALACEQGWMIIKREHERDLYPSQEAIADEIARNFRRDAIFGDGGKPLTGAYIKRHALKGVSSERRKQLSTVKHRGK